MVTGESAATVTAMSGWLVRWLPPSPPLAVDDDPLWRPAADPLRRRAAGDAQRSHGGRSHAATAEALQL
jgi:hypothetical protein